MEMKLFEFIDDTINYYNLHKAGYEYVMGQLKQFCQILCQDDKDAVVALTSRIKAEDSLKEKLIRNQFYLQCKDGEDAIAHLSDLIGITIQCRFIRNENEIYQHLFRHFDQPETGYAHAKENENCWLNLRMPQPQYQRNGFTIYRLDGYYLFNGTKVNYELQIKSMVHNFWSDIEHQVVYKNPDFVVYDRFNKSMLGAIRDNLDVVDRQLEIMYNEISDESSRKQIGMDEKGFKVFTAQSINELVNRKMIESVGFTTDFKKCSAILAQYIYIRDFVNGTHNREMMVDYLEHLNYLAQSEIDFKQEIFLEKPYMSDDVFCSKLGTYWQSIMNTDFQWHIFFAMLFSIQPGNNFEDLDDFVHVIERLLVQPGWFAGTFPKYSEREKKQAHDALLSVLAEGLISCGRVDIVHEDNLHKVMEIFRKFVNFCEERYPDYDSFASSEKAVRTTLLHQIGIIFQ
ncbi:MAG: hypothetical protein SOI44_01510 [Lactimicrobium sp.]|uniref:hypothetical protein n=1 Tax=Lactimicrobium sp. TaxID=2563780 RepID=UPI002F35211E